MVVVSSHYNNKKKILLKVFVPSLAFLSYSVVKESTCNAEDIEDLGLIPARC